MPTSITIKTLSGRKLAFDFDPDESIEDVKKILQEKEGIDSSQIRLAYGGKLLENELTIQEAKLDPKTPLMMMMHLKGG